MLLEDKCAARLYLVTLVLCAGTTGRAGDGRYFDIVAASSAVAHCVYSIVGLLFMVLASFLRRFLLLLAVFGRKQATASTL